MLHKSSSYRKVQVEIDLLMKMWGEKVERGEYQNEGGMVEEESVEGQKKGWSFIGRKR